MTGRFLASLAALFPAAALVAQTPTIEEMDQDPNYQRVPSNTIPGSCERNSMLEGMMRSGDAVKKVHAVPCDHMIYALPGDTEETRQNGFLSLARRSRGGSVFLKGEWDEGDLLELEFTEISFDQEVWYPVSKGRMRGYEGFSGTMFMIFAVFEVERKGGRKRNEAISVAFYAAED